MRESSSSLVMASARISCSLRSAKRFIEVSRWVGRPIVQCRNEKCEPSTHRITAPLERTRGAVRTGDTRGGDAPRPLARNLASLLVGEPVPTQITQARRDDKRQDDKAAM